MGQDQLGGVVGQALDVDADHLAFGELLADLPEVVLQAPDHHRVPGGVVDGDSPAELLRVEHLEQRREAVGVPVVRSGGQEELVLEPLRHVSDGAGEL